MGSRWSATTFVTARLEDELLLWLLSIAAALASRLLLHHLHNNNYTPTVAAIVRRLLQLLRLGPAMQWDEEKASDSDSASLALSGSGRAASEGSALGGVVVEPHSAGSCESIAMCDSEACSLALDSGGSDVNLANGADVMDEVPAPPSGGLAPHSGGLAPHSGGFAPHSGGFGPPSEGVASHSGGSTPHSGGLATCFSWATVALSLLGRALGQENIRASLLVSSMAFSTHFTGVGSVELAITCLVVAAPGALGFPVRLTSSFACERDRACQRLLDIRLPSSGCLFSDMFDCSPAAKELFEAAAPQSSVDFKTARETIMNEAVVLRRPCRRHLTACQQPHTDGDISGSPCTPWSSAGRQGRERDPRICLLLVWCRWLLGTRPKWAIHENVRRFNRDLLQDLVATAYDVVFLETDPGDAGFVLLRRPRLYAVCLLRGRVKEAHSMLAMYGQLRDAFARQGRVTFQSCLIASAAELFEEENKARTRRNLPHLTAPTAIVDWTYLLTPRQAESLRVYCEKYPEAEAVNLGHNADKRPSIACDGQLPTLTRNAGCWWVLARKRWMTSKELAAASGYPVTAELSKAANVATDPCADAYVPGQIGNCMHVANVGCVVAVALACMQDV